MDIPRPDLPLRRRRRRIAVAVGTVVTLAVITLGLSRLESAAPTVDRDLVWVDTVKRGPMIREVRGPGTLVPENVRWVPSRTSGRVERILLRPGEPVQPDSVVLELFNPEVEQLAEAAHLRLRAGEAALDNLRVQLQSALLEAEARSARARADAEQARLQAEVNRQLHREGILSEIQLRLSNVTAEESATRNELEQRRLAFAREAVAPQIRVQEAELDQLRAEALLRRQLADGLRVRAGMAGVLQSVGVEAGEQVAPGASLFRVADTGRLKAELRIAETQVRDVAVGQIARIDTRNGIAAGRVVRIDPAATNGTVTVDVVFTEDLPRGARPDLNVDGTIELERLADVVLVGRPAMGQDDRTTGLFRLDPSGSAARLVQVRLGRSSVNTIEVLEGLEPGDRVILSDMSAWADHTRIRLN